MPAKTATKAPATDEIRVLLMLWALVGAKSGGKVGRGSLPDSIRGTKDKVGRYAGSFKNLEKVGAISFTTEKKRYEKISLTSTGENMLVEGINSPEFKFDAAISGKTANALLNLLRSANGAIGHMDGNGKVAKIEIASYEEFRQVVLETFDRLNRDYNMANLVPIYRIRREIDGRVSRPQFSEWLFAMQSDSILELLEESVEDSAPDKIEDSVTTKLGKLRCYVKRMSS